jgi:hypothetical protein
VRQAAVGVPVMTVWSSPGAPAPRDRSSLLATEPYASELAAARRYR